jgi:hypothetical protein
MREARRQFAVCHPGGPHGIVLRMPTTLAYPHIVKPPGEAARLERHPRTRVAMIVLDYQHRGWSAEEIVRQYPYLTLAEVHAALAYYHDHQTEVDHELAEERADARKAQRDAPVAPVAARLKALKARRGA